MNSQFVKQNPSEPTIILFSESFPYGIGEQFLETEISILADVFPNIIIVPRVVVGNCRKIPLNVSVDLTLSSMNREAVFERLCFSQYRRKATYLLKEYFQLFKLKIFKSVKNRTFVFFRESECVYTWLNQFFNNDSADSGDTIIYTYWFYVATLGAVIFRNDKKESFRIVSRAHGVDLYEERHNPAYIPFREITFKGVDRVFPVSKNGAHYLIDKYPFAKNKITVSRLGVCDPGFTAQSSPAETFRILSCSFLLPVKRLDLLIRSFQYMCYNHMKIEWIHIGGGVLRDELEKLANRVIPKEITWKFVGHISNSEVYDYYRNNCVDLFVNVSSSEGLPVSMMEAISVGVPVLGTDVGGVSEIVSDENGALLDKGCMPQDIAKSITELIKSRELYPVLKTKSRNKWNDSYNAFVNYNYFSQAILALSKK